MRMAGHVASMGKRSGPYNVLVGRVEGKKPLGRPKYIWKCNVETSLLEVGLGDMEWIVLANDMKSC
jgi:hypothetical protein